MIHEADLQDQSVAGKDELCMSVYDRRFYSCFVCTLCGWLCLRSMRSSLQDTMFNVSPPLCVLTGNCCDVVAPAAEKNGSWTPTGGGGDDRPEAESGRSSLSLFSPSVQWVLRNVQALVRNHDFLTESVILLHGSGR